MSSVPEALPNVSAEEFPAIAFTRQTFAVGEADVRKLVHDPVELLTRMVQPVLWLLIFGQVFNRTHAIPTGGISYLDFMAPGILAQSVLFGAIFYGISLIWERDLGIVQKDLVSPSPRSTLVLGRAISSTVRSLCQMVFVYLLSYLLHIQLRFGIFALAGVVLAVMLGSAIFATFSLIIACLVKSRERFMGIGQLMTMPLFFASNAIYPLALMPRWLRVVAVINPLTYLVDALRGLMVAHAQTLHGPLINLGFLCIVFVGLLAIATKLYPSLAR